MFRSAGINFFLTWIKKGSFLCLVLVCLLMQGCGQGHESDGGRKTHGLREKKIQADIEETDDWKRFNVKTKDFNVIKRQTNIDDKEDVVYLCIEGENDRYIVKQYYIATYNLYNEGWILDSLDELYNDKYQSFVQPTKRVSQEMVDEQSRSVKGRGKLEALFSFSDAKMIEFHPQAVSVDYYLAENYGYDEYAVSARTEYAWFDEEITIPIVFNFEFISSDYGYGWVGRIDENRIIRNIKLNSGILGYWEDDYYNGDLWGDPNYPSPFYAKLAVSDYSDDSCLLEFHSCTFNGSFYTYGVKDYSGSASLDVYRDDNTGKITDVSLVFDSDNGVLNYQSLNNYLGEILDSESIYMNRYYIVSHRDIVFHKRQTG
ncbi:MAG: hypothetical protein K6G17_05435 [Oscillospiraceae bacterium]|nr:hypothetical protein [Oscillospiraceae bacterium]